MTGDIIKQERKKKNLTQIELAKKVGISRNALINYEAGTRIPPINVQLKLADVLGIDILDLKDSIPQFNQIKNIIKDTIEENNKITNQIQFILQAFNRIGINYKVVKYTNNKTPLEYEIYFDNTSFILNIDDFVDIYDKTQNNFDSFIMAIISTICNYKQNHR